MLKWFKRKASTESTKEKLVPSNNSADTSVDPARDTAVIASDVDSKVDRGMRLLKGGAYGDAANLFREVLQQDPANFTALYQSVNIFLSLADVAGAKRECDHALSIWPDHADLLLLRAFVAKRASDHELSLATLRDLQSVHPTFPDLDIKIAEECATLGRGPEAIAAMDRAVASNADELSRKSVRLFYLNYFALLDREQLFEEHRKWGSLIDEGFATLRKPLAVDVSADRPLRIGLVSGDLRSHAVALFIEGYLREHNGERSPIHCFDVSPHAEDSTTKKLRGMVEHWYRVSALDDDALADEIRRQKIDVLVDLSGHTMFNRLLVFARRPAPVQVSWFGYMNTTGLTSIDYRLTDPGHDPVGESDRFYSEKLFHIPSLACFSPPESSPPVAPPPFVRNGKVTFFSANQWTKVTESVIDLWAEILKDDSRPTLRISAKSAGSQSFRESVTEQFVRRGVLAEQIEIQPFLPMAEFLASFSEVDVALDPFPYGGGTTTLHTIWMGVPIIALAGEGELGRATPAMLRSFGLPDFVAQTHDEYRDKAIALARDPSRLVEIRANLRQRMADSPALDASGLARNVENAFRTMWHTYCASRTTLAQPDAPTK